MNNISLQCYDVLLQFEREFNPYAFRHKGFPVWLSFRQSMYQELLGRQLTDSAILQNPVDLTSSAVVRGLSRLTAKSKYISRAPSVNVSQARGKIVFVSTEDRRRIFVGEKIMNQFVDPLRLLDVQERIFSIERIVPNYRCTRQDYLFTFKAIDLFLLQIMAYIRGLFAIRFKPEAYHLNDIQLARISDSLCQLGISRNWFFRRLKMFISLFDMLSVYWRRFFLIARPSCVVSIEWYSRANMIMHFIANQMNIPTVEMMHGMIRPYHPGYGFGFSWPRNVLQGSYPTYLLVYGKYFRDALLNGGTLWDEKNIFDTGNIGLDYSVTSLKSNISYIRKRYGIPPGKKVLVFSSQNMLHNFIITEFNKLQIPKDWLVIIKLHPNEPESGGGPYHALKRKAGLSILGSSDSSIYELLNIATAHASLSSTVLWEASAYGIPNFVLPYPGVEEASSDLVARRLAKVAELPAMFRTHFNPDTLQVSYIFSNLDGTTAQKSLEFLQVAASGVQPYYP